MITVLVILSCLFTIIHLLDEAYGEDIPLWYTFGNISLIRIPDWLGFLTFTLVLGSILIHLSFSGYLYNSTMAISILLGSRIGDFIISHMGLYLLGLSNPNPGFFSSFLYIPEAILIICLFTINWWWVLAGIAFFASILPILSLLRFILPNSFRIGN